MFINFQLVSQYIFTFGLTIRVFAKFRGVQIRPRAPLKKQLTKDFRDAFVIPYLVRHRQPE